MAICRFGSDSDVYVYYSIYGGLECCGCRLNEKVFKARDEREMLSHLERHRAAGHRIPAAAFDDLAAESR